jgi:TRAP-type mannitol/chloroaromatic compound transport system permease small subunit
VLALIPAGFAILLLTALSELVKRVAFLTGHRSEPFTVEHEKTAEEQLAEDLLAAQEQQGKGAR